VRVPVSLLHRIAACLAVTRERLRSQPLRVALVLLGTALAFAMFVAVLGGSLVARQQALGRALAELPESSRGFRVDRFGLPLDQRTYASVDARARRALRALGGGRTRRVIMFRELRVQGERVEIGATDDLRDLVELRAGRLPRSCTSRECEVLQIGPGGAARLAEGDVRLRRVGIARLRDARLFGDISAATGGAANPPMLLLARDVRALRELRSLASFYRVYSWVSPLRAGHLHTWDIDQVLADESRTQAVLAGDPALRLSGPDAALLETQRRGKTAERRLLLVGGGMSALLLGFAVIAAVGLRRGLASERRRLSTRGARRWQIALFASAEVAVITCAAALLGLAAGTGVAAGIAARAQLPIGAAVVHTIATKTALLVLIAAWAGTTVLIVLTTRSPGTEDDRRLRLVDIAAVCPKRQMALGSSPQ
jgi:hypothetical protein